jgi:hypothetical protein
MGYWAPWRVKWALLNVEQSGRTAGKAMSITRARSIGIVYDATDREAAEIVKEWVGELRAMQKEVNSLGFVNAKHEEEIPKSKPGMDFFGLRHVNFSLKPTDPIVISFEEKPFDLLFDLNVDANPVLLNIVSKSKAGFIVGVAGKGKEFRDLYFEIKASDTDSGDAGLKKLRDLIRNIKKYTTEI